MIEACCMSDYWTANRYDPDNTTAIALSFNGSFAPRSAKAATNTKEDTEPEDSKEEEDGAAAAADKGADVTGLGDFAKPAMKKRVSFADNER